MRRTGQIRPASFLLPLHVAVVLWLPGLVFDVQALEAIKPERSTLVWLSTGVGDSRRSASTNVLAYDAESRNVHVGIERGLTSALTGGVSIGRSTYDVDTTGQEKDESKTTDVQVFGRLSLGDYRLSGSVAMRDHETDQARVFLFGRGEVTRRLVLDAKIDATEWIFNVAASRDFDIGDSSFLSPELSLTHIRISTDNFIETSSGLAGIEVRTADQNQWLANASLNGGTLWPVGDWVWSAGGLIGVERLVAADRPRSASTFVGSRYAFTSEGYEQSKTGFLMGASLSARHLGGMGASLGVAHHRQDGFRNTSLSLEIEYDF
jgi:Autotransporter beta-domain